jgi:hypothetical protein
VLDTALCTQNIPGNKRENSVPWSLHSSRGIETYMACLKVVRVMYKQQSKKGQ